MKLEKLKQKLKKLLQDIDTVYVEERRKSRPNYQRGRNLLKQLSARQKKLLSYVASKETGVSRGELVRFAKSVGYKNPNSYGGYLKGRRASLVKIYSDDEEKIAISKVGKDLLNNSASVKA